MKKILSALLFLGIVQLQADFIAFRKLTHQKDNKTIYMLYDVHVSIEKDRMSYDVYRDHRDSLQEEMSSLFRQMIGKDEREEKLSENKETLTKQYAELFRKKYLPTLYQQQKDLLALVKNCGLSLINEDWRDQINGEEYDANAKSELQFLLGMRDPSSSIRLSVSPMQSIGEKLVGKYTENKLQTLPGDTYYYNAEVRSGRSADASDGAEKVDKEIIKGINTILNDKEEDTVIVSAGASHCVRIIEYFEKQGYQSENLITNPGLTGWWRSSRVKKIAEDLKKNVEPDLSTLTSSNKYQLASYPIDLAKVFGKEFPKCKLSTDSLEVFDHEISDFVKSLFE